ncbi:hypothetical protein D9756_002074 [Leucocoprinus leucothites]|uniref:MYND-type domain-containing protein n=1 Tax=Leucocoprinus leucothites TaxID=201217 RepID=A0A8H5GBF4_9AGAR|nr:hypothetical protein D9756_002074 [Leucoagaricus leucothites]
MSSLEQHNLSRDDIIHVLKGMNIDLVPNTKVNAARLKTRLGEALDAAQRFSTTFPDDPDAVGGINLSNYPLWKKRTPVVDAFTRRTWAAIFQDNREYEDQRQLAFPRLIQLIPDIGKDMDQKRIGYVVLKDMTVFRALIIRFFSTFEIDEKTPLVLCNYAVVEEEDEETLEDSIADLTPEDQRGRAYPMTDVEQNLFVTLLSLNRKHLSPRFRLPAVVRDDRCDVGFILPIGSLNMKDVIRLSKIGDCPLCGEETHHTCKACLSARYCGRDCQREDWRNHRSLCRTISTGKWYNITLEPNPFSALMSRMYKTSITRYYDDSDENQSPGAEVLDEAPPNYHGDAYYLVKLQVPLGADANQVLVYDQFKTFELHLSEAKNPEAFIAALFAVAREQKMYRWVHREGEWEWKICFDRIPERLPTW